MNSPKSSSSPTYRRLTNAISCLNRRTATSAWLVFVFVSLFSTACTPPEEIVHTTVTIPGGLHSPIQGLSEAFKAPFQSKPSGAHFNILGFSISKTANPNLPKVSLLYKNDKNTNEEYLLNLVTPLLPFQCPSPVPDSGITCTPDSTDPHSVINYTVNLRKLIQYLIDNSQYHPYNQTITNPKLSQITLKLSVGGSLTPTGLYYIAEDATLQSLSTINDPAFATINSQDFTKIKSPLTSHCEKDITLGDVTTRKCTIIGPPGFFYTP